MILKEKKIYNTNFNPPQFIPIHSGGVRGYLFLFLIFSFQFISAQSPKREMRATWLATVWQIDWPSSVVLSTGNSTQIAVQKDLMIRILDSLVSANMNAVCFQVRSRCDAMYNSAYEPWSTDLVATRGMNPGYDPLQFVIDEGHKRGIEVHAWLNPYRYETQLNQWTGQAGDYRTLHPDWILTYSNGVSILDPGRPEVVKRIKQVVGDIIQKYDVDGILFDDYFYAYGGTPATLDASTQTLYKPADMELGNWRRSNVNKMVAAVYDTIQQVKPYVRFGVSPFGIWTTNENVAIQEGIPLPEGISGGDMYSSIYCDPVAWLKQGTVDYISPQLYWGTGGSQDYGTLSPWWSALSNQFGKHFYSSQDIAGLATSNYAPALRIPRKNVEVDMNGERLKMNGLSQIERKISLSKPMKVTAGNFTQEQIGIQIGINRSADENGAPGSIFFSTKQLYQTRGFINYLKKYQFTQKAIVPAIDWKQHADVGLVQNISLNERVLSWNAISGNVRYAVYAIPNNVLAEVGNFKSSKYLIGISYSTTYTIPTVFSTTTNTFAIAVLDRYGNEYAPRVMGQALGTSTSVNLISPINNATVIIPFVFSWEADANVEFYKLEIAEDAFFTNIICSRELNTTSFSTNQFEVLRDDKVYYWRVKCRKPNAIDGVSEMRSFIPQRFKIIEPVSGATNVSLTPVLSWQNVGNENSYLIEIATNSQFTQNSILLTQLVSSNSFAVPQKVLSGSSVYYARVSTTILGSNITSSVINFTTLNIIPEIPSFISPTMNSSVSGNSIKVTWNEGVTSGYWIEMSKESTFPVRNTTIKTVGAYIYEVNFTGLIPADYYFRIRASYSNTYTSWSDTLKTTLITNTGISEVRIGSLSCKLIRNNNNEIQISFNTLNQINVSVSLLNLSGIEQFKLCNNKPLAAGENVLSFDNSNMSKGVYLLHVTTDEGVCVLKYIR